VQLTTKQKANIALAIPCPVHGTPAGETCTLASGVLAGSCMKRREVALAPFETADRASLGEAALDA
jgi:hypothetical protein